MPFLRNAKKRNCQKSRAAAGPGDHRARLQRFKAMLEKMDAVDLSEFDKAGLERTDGISNKRMQRVLGGYARNGSALWDYARAVTNSLPETEREREMADIKRLLERAGFRESLDVAPMKRAGFLKLFW